MPIKKGDSESARKIANFRWSKCSERTNTTDIGIKIDDLDFSNCLHLEELNKRVIGYILFHPDLSAQRVKMLRMLLSLLRNQSKLLIIRRGQELEQKSNEPRNYIEKLKEGENNCKS